MEIRLLRAWLVSLLAATFFQELDSAGEGFDESQKPHVRQKRLLWITSDGRLALPPGTHLTITPSLSLPFVRYPPDGFLSNMSISLPFSSEYISPKVQHSFIRMCQVHELLYFTSFSCFNSLVQVMFKKTLKLN